MFLKQQPKKILVMRYRFIGDTLLTVPFLRNLRQAYPHAQIDLLVGPQSGEVLTHCPYVDELIYFDTTRKHRYEVSSTEGPKSFGSYVHQLRKRRYDTAFVLKRSFSSAMLAFLAGIPQRVGFNTEHRRWLLTHPVVYDATLHEVDAFLSVLQSVGIPVTDRHLEAWWTMQEDQKVDTLLEREGSTPQIALHLTSSNRAKEWPLEQSIALARWLIQEKGIHLYCLGAASDEKTYQSLSQQLPAACQPFLHNLCGHTNLLESLAFLKRMDGLVGVDSGTLHMAASVGIPVVALFGPMNEQKWAPLGDRIQVVSHKLPCRPCNLKTPCTENFACMTQLSLSSVMEGIESCILTH